MEYRNITVSEDMPWKFFTEGTGTWWGTPPSQGIFLKC